MVISKSFRIDVMNYNYIITKNSIREINMNDNKQTSWLLSTIKNNLKENTINSSFNRSRQWILENYPELIL
jgi:hypothetical protein